MVRQKQKSHTSKHCCVVCGKGGYSLCCSGCNQTWYCGRACQTKDWKLGHRKQCAVLSNSHTVHVVQTPGHHTAESVLEMHEYCQCEGCMSIIRREKILVRLKKKHQRKTKKKPAICNSRNKHNKISAKQPLTTTKKQHNKKKEKCPGGLQPVGDMSKWDRNPFFEYNLDPKIKEDIRQMVLRQRSRSK